MDDKDREDLLKVVGGSINQWTGNIQLPNGTKLTGLNVGRSSTGNDQRLGVAWALGSGTAQ